MKKFAFSKIGQKLTSSIIRELLKDVNVPGMISFGGGVPDPKTFPRYKLSEVAKDVLENEFAFSLQYGPTEGDDVLKEAYINFLKRNDNIEGLTKDNLLITVGSQSALYLLSTILLDSESKYFVSKPVYLGAASAFSMNSMNHIDLPLSEDGIDTDLLEEKLLELDKKGEISKVRFIYVIPNFHNPAGVTLNLERRKKIIELAEKYDLLIIEDDPYGDLRYEGEGFPSLFKMAGKNRVLLLRTFSKVLSPGMRLGFVIGHEILIRKLVMAKQAVDLCSPSLTQRIAGRFLEKYDLKELLKPTIEIYRKKKDLMLEELERNFADMEGVHWTRPQGGLFIWLTLPEGYDTMEMMASGKKNGVLFIPGSAFSIGGGCDNSMRLSFCLPSEENIIEGVKRLKKTVVEYGKEKGLL
ncbi:aspartate aminotransferase [Kosmotoga arenicorallina S304]|uniref:Aspartate aminotransferase n=1 Tax=Kosmotoga arenicorallina S304 TaxID=1453497 RepID=A0A182C800_9BACT|nr:PLP-dependent aminotransferase family protein [Kosmotoga arenicorallina]OAA31888.1 aspartate aminotransferase [Kosmotoga arenicorallina S304]